MTARSSRRPWRHLALLAYLAATACAGSFPYSIPIQQGNVVTVEMLQELKLGMDKRKVTFILGTPLVTDAFHQDRWDYYYSYNPGGGDTVQQKASLYFKDDRLERIEADIQSNVDFHTVTHATDKVLVVPPKKKGGFFAAITPGFLKSDEQQAAEKQTQKELGSGVNEDQPGSGEVPASASATTTIDSAPEPSAGEVPLSPSEIYAPNSAVGSEAAKSPASGTAPETVSADTRNQSRYLESLFDAFNASTPAPARTNKPSSSASETETPESAPRDPTVPTRD